MDSLNTKIKNILTEKTLKIKPENIKDGVTIFGIEGELEQGITPTGTISITENGTVDVTNYASAEVNVASSGGKNIQYNLGMFVTSYTSYTASGLKLTVNKTGIYTVKWLNRKTSTSGTWQSGLYINKKLYGSYYSNWGMTYYKDYETTPKTSSEWQSVVIEHVELTEGDEIETYGRSNSNGNWHYHLSLVIEEE